MVILHSEFDICMPWFAIKTGQKIFRYHKLYDIIYIIYYEKIRMYIYILYLSPIDFQKKNVVLVNFPQPNLQPENRHVTWGARKRLGCEVSMREFVSKRILSKPRTSPRLRWNLGLIFPRSPFSGNEWCHYGSMGMHGTFTCIYLHEWLDLLW